MLIKLNVITLKGSNVIQMHILREVAYIKSTQKYLVWLFVHALMAVARASCKQDHHSRGMLYLVS